jgi:hypothetical protein
VAVRPSIEVMEIMKKQTYFIDGLSIFGVATWLINKTVEQARSAAEDCKNM